MHFLILFVHRSKDAVKHFPVRWDGQYFVFGFGRFSNVHELISHFESKPVIGGDSGIYDHTYSCINSVVTLTHAVARAILCHIQLYDIVLSLSLFHRRMRHLYFGGGGPTP